MANKDCFTFVKCYLICILVCGYILVFVCDDTPFIPLSLFYVSSTDEWKELFWSGGIHQIIVLSDLCYWVTCRPVFQVVVRVCHSSWFGKPAEHLTWQKLSPWILHTNFSTKFFHTCHTSAYRHLCVLPFYMTFSDLYFCWAHKVSMK